MSIYSEENRYATVEAYYGAKIQRFQMEPHRHDRCEIMYVVEGGCWVSTGTKRWRLEQKNFVFLDQGVLHALSVEPGSACTLMNLEFGCVPKGPGADLRYLAERSRTFRKFLERKEPWCFLYDSGNVCGALRDLLEALKHPALSEPYLEELLLSRLFLELSARPGEKGEGHFGIRYVNRAKAYILEHFDQDIHVKDVAEAVGLNAAYLQTLFSSHFGCGMMQFVSRLRIEKACFLLKNSKLSVTDVAFEAGYNNRQQFGYCFQHQLGKSPRQYRKELGYGFQKGIRQEFLSLERRESSPVEKSQGGQ